MKSVSVVIAAVARILRAMIGVPDYERYVEHCDARHPGSRPMTRDQFAADLLERKYSRPGTRCC